MIALLEAAMLLAWASAHRPDHAHIVDISRDVAKASAWPCHGCIWHGGCDPDASRIECDASGGIWHVEDPGTELVEGELGEFTSLSALDMDDDGEVSMQDLTTVLTALGEQPSARAVQRLKEQIDNERNSSLLSVFSSSSVALAEEKGKFIGALMAVITVVQFGVECHQQVERGEGTWADCAKDYAIDYVTDPCNYLPGVGKGTSKAATKLIGQADDFCTKLGNFNFGKELLGKAEEVVEKVIRKVVPEKTLVRAVVPRGALDKFFGLFGR